MNNWEPLVSRMQTDGSKLIRKEPGTINQKLRLMQHQERGWFKVMERFFSKEPSQQVSSFEHPNMKIT